MAGQIVTLIVEVGAGVGLATALATYAQRNWARRGPAAETIDA